MIQALLAEINRDAKKREEPYVASEFMPKFLGDSKGEPDEQDVEELQEQKKQNMTTKVTHLFRMLGGKGKSSVDDS